MTPLLPAVPKVIVTDFTKVMCLSQGITLPDQSESETATSTSQSTPLSSDEKKIVKNVGIIPPRREIGLFPSSFILFYIYLMFFLFLFF